MAVGGLVETREDRARAAVGRDAVASWLQRLPAGKGSSLFCQDVDEGRTALAEAGAQTSPPRTVVTLQWARLPRLRDGFAEAADALGRAALTMYPSLYASAAERTQRTDGNRRSTAAARRIRDACRAGKVPALRDLPAADHVRQLALAVDPETLVIQLVLNVKEWSDGKLLAFARGAEWLATNTSATVVLVLPRAMSENSALDVVTYRCLHLAAAVPDPDASSGGIETPLVSVSPILGKPHPGSEAERRLHEHITGDAELSSLFHFNQLVTVGDGHTPRVDLLWPGGRLVVEVDGHALHSRRHQFFADRDRDFRLLLSGYQVFRIDDAEILVDVARVLEKLRQLVRLIRRGPR